MDEKPGGNNLVMPGDKLGLEEEFLASENTFVDEDGAIRASIIGMVHTSDGKISVRNSRLERRPIDKGMLVLGTVTDDVKAVVFVKIDAINVGNVQYFPLKDGKIVAERSGPPRGGRSFDRGRDFGGRRDGRGGGREEAPKKTCKVGDVVLAKVLFNDPDVYTLGVRDRETGVVYAECELCGGHMRPDAHRASLVCPSCEHMEQRKISEFYGMPEEIKRLFSR